MKAKPCVDALVLAGITHPKPDSYMVAWPDDVSTATLADVPAYERRARNLVFALCVELSVDLREGRFPCADVRAEKILKITTPDPAHADVRYAREIVAQQIDKEIGMVAKGEQHLQRHPAEAGNECGHASSPSSSASGRAG